MDAKAPGGLYINADGKGFHDANGKQIPEGEAKKAAAAERQRKIDAGIELDEDRIAREDRNLIRLAGNRALERSGLGRSINDLHAMEELDSPEVEGTPVKEPEVSGERTE